jgi:hypothetical protein
MFKNSVIFLFLAVAYSVLLAHNFTPHHHAEQSASHHEHNGRVHTHDQDSEKNTEDDSNAFEHFQHFGAPEIQYYPVHFKNKITVRETHQNLLWEAFAVALPNLEKTPPNLSHRPREESLILTQSLAYFFSLKAPPAVFA